MNTFNRFIDSVKATYISVLENKKSFIKPSVMILVIRFIQVVFGIIIGIFLVDFFVGDIYFEYDNYSFEPSLAIKYIVLIIISILLFLVLHTISIIIEAFTAIYIVDEIEITFEDMKNYILENFFKIYGGLIVIGILSTIVISIAYLLFSIILIPIAILTFGIGFIFINTYIFSLFTYWKLFAIRYEISAFEALSKNIKLKPNNLLIIVLFNLILASFTSILGSIIGFLAIPIVIVMGLIVNMITNIFVLKLIEN